MTDRISYGRAPGRHVVEALGFEAKRVRDVRLNFDANGLVTATVELFVTEEQLDALGIPRVHDARKGLETR